MNIIQRNITYLFYYKKYVDGMYLFLEKYDFKKITDKKIIKEWDNDSVYKKGSITISIGHDYKEERFATYFFDERKYNASGILKHSFYLEEYLSKHQNINKFRKLTMFNRAKNFDVVIGRCSKMLKEYIVPIMEFLESEEWKKTTYLSSINKKSID